MKLLKKNIHFVVGMSRSGTTWMTKCLNTHKACAAFGETLFWGRLYLKPNSSGRYSKQESLKLLKILQNTCIGPYENDYGSLSAETIKAWNTRLVDELKDNDLSTPDKIFSSLCQFIADKENKNFILEKTPHHINWVDRIKKNYPSSKFIIMIREPYGVMRSYKNQGLQKNERVRKIHAKQYHPIQAALVWRGYSRSVLSIKSVYPDDIYVINNHDLFSNSETILKETVKFLGLPYMDGFEKNLPGRANSSVESAKRMELDSSDYFWLHLIAGKEIKKMGYTIKNNSITYMPIFISILKLPLWMIRTIILLKSNSKANLFEYILRWLK